MTLRTSARSAAAIALLAAALAVTRSAAALEAAPPGDTAAARGAVSPASCEEPAGHVDEPSPWTLSARVGGSVISMEFPGYGNSIVVPVEIGIARRAGPVRLGAYGAGANGLSLMQSSSKSVAQWHVGGFLEYPFGSMRAGWLAINGGYTALEADVAHVGPELGLSGGLDLRVAARTTIGPFLSVNVASVDGGKMVGNGYVREEPASLIAWAAVGARVTFDGL